GQRRANGAARGPGGSLLLIFDNFDRIDPAVVDRLFDSFFPQVDASVRVMLASRGCLIAALTAYAAWTPLVHPLRLRCLSPEQVFDYVRQRGLDDDALARTIFEATGGHP